MVIIHGLQTCTEDDKICHFSLLSVIVRNVFGLLVCVVNEHLRVEEIQIFFSRRGLLQEKKGKNLN